MFDKSNTRQAVQNSFDSALTALVDHMNYEYETKLLVELNAMLLPHKLQFRYAMNKNIKPSLDIKLITI